ncbi:MAG: hypothetical protein KJP00_06105 [Bacteroidia bacterium]|nr:hypothetical protein [Bacteroidia bacterium]
MKKSKLLFLVISILSYNIGSSQIDLSVYDDIESVTVTSYWGDINVIGTEASADRVFTMEVVHTDSENNAVRLDQIEGYVDLSVENKQLYIETRTPEGFESIDLNLKIPAHLFLDLKLIKGGNIYADNLKNGVEINILNGSVKIERIGKYALVNAANGEISAEFENIDSDKPVSLVTMNGGITVSLPGNIKRDVRMISRKNGYIQSDFPLASGDKISLNTKQYSKTPIIHTARINGGGALLFLSTENGPLSIKKS